MAQILRAIQEFLPSYFAKKGISFKDIQKAQSDIRACYSSHKNSRHLDQDTQIASYAIGRMPATYSAVKECLKKLPIDFKPASILDIGAGPGTATLAALDKWESLKTAYLVEQHPLMQELGTALFSFIGSSLQVEYHKKDVNDLEQTGNYDLVILSYLLGELNEKQQLAVLEKAWSLTNGYCLIVTPGTPYDYRYLMKARDFFRNKNGEILAPCPHSRDCPLLGKEDWCHFSTRVERTKWHQYTKQGSLNYEDEKFSYLLISKEPAAASAARIIRKPIQKPGHIILDLCTTENLERKIIGKKDRVFYKKAAKVKWGDVWE